MTMIDIIAGARPNLRQLLAEFGVPGDAVVLESESRNTEQNAQRSAQTLRPA